MKVKYIPTLGGTPDTWLTEGTIYIVLEVYAGVDTYPGTDKVFYRLISNSSTTPALHPARLFEVINPRIPSTWIVSVGKDGNTMNIGPSKWAILGFWEKFFDQDPEARKIFDQESYKIVAEED